MPPPYLAPLRTLDERRTGAVGLCWRGGDWDSERTIPRDRLLPLIEAAAGRLWSLQPGEGGSAFANPDGCDLDMLRTAALLLSLEHVVTIDSMVAHLAGALGRPAIVLLRAEADWRWGDRGRACGLYPAHTLLRQPEPGAWDAPVRAAARLVGKRG